MHHLLILHGPNLNLLGEREPDVYGENTLFDVNQAIREYVRNEVIDIRIFQSNHAGALIDHVHDHRRWADGIVINPGGLTHTSVALRDAISSVSIPTVEVHLSDIRQREPFRKTSYLEPVCIQQISGYGLQSYIKGIDALISLLKSTE